MIFCVAMCCSVLHTHVHARNDRSRRPSCATFVTCPLMVCVSLCVSMCVCVCLSVCTRGRVVVCGCACVSVWVGGWVGNWVGG